jgi:hypothetical protein
VGVEKGGAAAREGVEVRGLRERMAAERSDPVVQIIDEDEEDVGSRNRRQRGGFNGESD